MKIYLQSFFSKPLGVPFSVARFQPRRINHLSINFLKPIKPDGSVIRGLPPEDYLVEYCEVLKGNSGKIISMIKNLEKEKDDYSFLCWCNPERQYQYKQLYCHTILIGYLIEKVTSKVEVIYLDGRDNPVWSREEFYKVMKGG